MEQTGVDEVTKMEKDAAELWFTSLTAGVIVGIDKIIMLIALIVYRIGWWATIYCQQILLGMLTIFGPIQWAVLAVAQMGRCMGEVAYKVSDSTFLWCNALLRRLLCATVIRHCTVHTGRKPDGNHSKRTDNGGLLAKQLLLRRLLDGGKYRGTEMPKPRAGLGSMDDT